MKTRVRFIRWLPRILAMVIIFLVSLFALDSFEGDFSIWRKLLGFFIHLIYPSLVFLAILILAWRRELLGGILWIIASLILSWIVFKINYLDNDPARRTLLPLLLIGLPLISVGLLFILSHYLKEKSNPE